MSSTTTRRLTVNNISVPVIEAGPANAEEAVVFVHGNPGSGEDWTALVAEVGSFARAIAPSMPGFGSADKPKDFQYTIEGYSAFLGTLLEQLGIRKVHLVLHDFGGPWGLHWAAQHPQAFASISLINTGVLLGYRWHFMARLWQMPVIGELVQWATTRWLFRRSMKIGNPRGLPREFVDRMYDDYDAGTRRAVLKLYRATRDPAGMGEMVSALLRPLARPALVIWGKHDPYISIRQAARQRETFVDAEIHVLEDSGHWPFADNPAAVSAALIPFLRRQFSR